ncbi:MAG: CRTAC1 family protein [Candidatus Hatepunaea meridiana]|nr:CRTAC1 family protein [Candidatus Hatepunaea meridiana]
MQKQTPLIFLLITTAFLFYSCEGIKRESLTKQQQAENLLRRGQINEARTLISPDNSIPSDSAGLALWGESYETEGDWYSAAETWKKAADLFPEAHEFRLHYWQTLVAISGEDTLLADSMQTLVRTEGDRFAQMYSSRLDTPVRQTTSQTGVSDLPEEAYPAMLLAYWSANFLGDTTVTERADRLIASYPDSQDVIDITGNLFWDGLYPVWRRNWGRIGYLTEFIEKYKVPSWQSSAWRSLISAYGQVGDTAAVIRETNAWVATAPNDPYILVTASSFIVDFGGEDTARVWAERAYQFKDNLTRPLNITTEEWDLYDQQIEAKLPLKLARIHLDAGELSKAKQYAKESLNLAVYDVDEYATQAPQHYILGRIFLADGDTNRATDHFIKALIEGEVRNLSPSLADSILREIHQNELANTSAHLDSQAGTPAPPGNEDILIEFCRERTDYNGISFTRVTEEVGLGEARGSRFAWGDYDNDGDDDLLIGGRNLYRNDSYSPLSQPGCQPTAVDSGGAGLAVNPPRLTAEDNAGGLTAERRFINRTHTSGLNTPGFHGAIWGDYDNDGWLDLFFFSSSSDPAKAERLFHNNGDETFTNITAASGYIRDTHSTEAAIWADFNGDGRLDLFIAGYERPYGSASDMGSGWPDRLLIQDEDGVFHNQTEEAGMIPPQGKHLCARSPITCDFDRDGDLDLYIGNYRLQQNLFWINDGKGSFENRADWYKVDGELVDGWWGHTIGCQWGDFDGDGDFDLIAGNLAHPRYISFSNRTMLYRNDGDDKGFTDVRREWGIKYDECHSEPLWGDLDNDGDLDLFITSVYPDRRSYLYRNDGDNFTDVTYLSGTRIFNGWGCALSDYDNDGDLDLITRDNGKVELFRNDTESGNWVEIVVDPPRIGTIVEITIGRKKQVRQIEGGKGAGSQSSMTLHFGVGKAKKVSAQAFYGNSNTSLTTVEINKKNVIKF